MKTNKMNNKKFFNLKDYVEANYDKPLDKEALINYPLLNGAVSLVKSTIFDKEGMQNTDEFIIKEVAPGLTCCYCDIADASRKNPLIRVIVLPMGAEISDNTIFFLSDASERYILSNGLEYCFYVKDKIGISLCADINLQKCSVEDIEFMSKISTETFNSLMYEGACSAEDFVNIANVLTNDATFISDSFVEYLREATNASFDDAELTVEAQLYKEFLEHLAMRSDSFVEFIQKKSGVNASIESIREALSDFMGLKPESVSDEDSVSADELWDSSEYEDDDNLFTPDEDAEVDEDIDEETLEGILKFISEDEELNSLINTIAENEGVEVSEVINKVFKDKNVEGADKITSLGDFWGDDEAEDGDDEVEDNEDVIDDITSSDIFGTFGTTDDAKNDSVEVTKDSAEDISSIGACSLKEIKKLAGCHASKMTVSVGRSISDLRVLWDTLAEKKQFAGVSVFGQYYQTYDLLGAVRAVMDILVEVVRIGACCPDKKLNKLISSVVCFEQKDCSDKFICYRGKFIKGISDTNVDVNDVLFFMRQAARVLKKYVGAHDFDKSLATINLVFSKKASESTLSEKQKLNQEKGTIKTNSYYRVTSMKQKFVENNAIGFIPCKVKIAGLGKEPLHLDAQGWGGLMMTVIKFVEDTFGGTENFCKNMMGKSDLIHYTYDEFKKYPEHKIPTDNIRPVLYKGTDCDFYYNQSRKNTQVLGFLKKVEDAFGLKLSIRFKAK